MLIESFATMISRWLRIPPGTSLRKSNGPSTTSGVDPLQNEYIQAMLSITVDDICIGDEPLSVNYKDDTPDTTKMKLEELRKEFNSIVKWATNDLLSQGYSVYDVKVSKKNRLILLPYLEEVEFYLTEDKEVVLFKRDDLKKNITDKLVFINYNKWDLEQVDDKNLSKKIKFRIKPSAMQLANSSKTLSGLSSAEDALAKYRSQLGRIARWVNVDIGTTQGDTQDEVVNSISEAINANSSSLAAGTAYTEFDDNIPVLPNRRGLGKADIVSDIPNANIKDLSDIDYWLSKLNLIMRFPATYMDFSKNLDATAVSLVRGDIRYKKLCKAVSSKVTSTINEYFAKSKFSEYEVVFSLTNLPSSEDDDVVAALQDYIDLAEKIDSFVMGDEAAALSPLHRLELLQQLFAPVTNSPTLQDWFDNFREIIKQQTEPEANLEGEESSEGIDESFEGGEDFTLDEGPSEGGEAETLDTLDTSEIEESPDFELIEPQTGGI